MHAYIWGGVGVATRSKLVNGRNGAVRFCSKGESKLKCEGLTFYLIIRMDIRISNECSLSRNTLLN